MEKLTIVVLTRNSEETIKKCIKACLFADEIIVVDDNSTDKTVKIIKSIDTAKVIVLKRSLNADFAAQRNFALSRTKNKWIFFVDSDEIITTVLAKEINKIIRSKNPLDGYYLRRKDYVWDKELRHGESGNIKLLRFGVIVGEFSNLLWSSSNNSLSESPCSISFCFSSISFKIIR